MKANLSFNLDDVDDRVAHYLSNLKLKMGGIF
jgi:hypothetical protein